MEAFLNPGDSVTLKLFESPPGTSEGQPTGTQFDVLVATDLTDFANTKAEYEAGIIASRD